MIRPARIDDLPALVDIENDVFAKDRISRRNFRHLLTRGRAVSLVDEDSNGLCGYITVLFRRGAGWGRLYSLAVLPRCRGRRLGEQLLAAAEQACRKRGCSSLRLEVHPDNAVAQRLYDRTGYRAFGRYPEFYEDGADALRLEKPLAGKT
jgi:ribosomal protein S18 acetylase RimI-like enzyme